MMSTREITTHIYKRVLELAEQKRIDPNSVDDQSEISYILHLIQLHFESDYNLGSKGFESISVKGDKRESFGC
jgi:hypothetical protein